MLGDSAHPFSATPGRGDNRITTRFGEGSLEACSAALHEFGHGLYEAQVDPALARTALGRGVSMAVHESQSRLWEVFVGGSVRSGAASGRSSPPRSARTRSPTSARSASPPR